MRQSLGMAVRIDPRIPVVWRSPSDLQLGAARPLAVIRDADDVDLALLEAMRAGAARASLERLARRLGADDGDVDVFLATVEAAVDAPDPQVHARVAIDGDPARCARLAADLAAVGHEVVGPAHDPDAVDLAVVVADHVVDPRRVRGWMARDVPHLRVLVDDDGVVVGPLVEPGEGPCLHCVELARADADDAWPAIASQLLGRPARGIRPLTLLQAMTAATLAVDARLRRDDLGLADRAIRFDAVSAEPRSEPVPSHPRCGCRSLAGTVTALAPHATGRPARPSSPRAGVVPA